MLNITEFHLLENITLLNFVSNSDEIHNSLGWNVTSKIFETFQTDKINAMMGLMFYISMLIFGNGALSILIIYEKVRMDPQKRTINNQLLSKCCYMLILRNTFLCPGIVIRMFWNIPLGKYLLIILMNMNF